MQMPCRRQITRIANYLRRSRQDMERERRTGEDTLATQKKIMQKVLDDMKVPYDQFEEIGSGDRIENRPVFRQVLDDLGRDKYDAVAVKEIPRLGRGAYSDMGRIYDLLVSKRILIITPYKIYDPQNLADARQIRFELFFAREEFEMIKERLTSAKYNLACEGKWVCGAAPFGYRLNRHNTRLEVYEEEACVIRLIFNFYVHGLEKDGAKREVSFRAIASYLTGIGVSTPRRAAGWSFLSVKRIIENVAYTGTLKYRTRRRIGNRYIDRPEQEWIVVEHAHEPVVDLETWDAARAKLGGNRALARVRLDFSPSELAGLVVCARCGRRMVRQHSVRHYSKKSGGNSVYKREFLWCPTPGCACVKYRDVESSILSYIEMLGEFDATKLDEVHREACLKQKKAVSVLDAGQVIEKRKVELKRRLQFSLDKHVAGIYDDRTFLMSKDKIDKEMALLGSIAEVEGGEMAQGGVKTAGLNGNITTFLEAYRQAGSRVLKNRLLGELISHVALEKTGKGKFDLVIYPRFDL